MNNDWLDIQNGKFGQDEELEVAHIEDNCGACSPCIQQEKEYDRRATDLFNQFAAIRDALGGIYSQLGREIQGVMGIIQNPFVASFKNKAHMKDEIKGWKRLADNVEKEFIPKTWKWNLHYCNTCRLTAELLEEVVLKLED